MLLALLEWLIGLLLGILFVLPAGTLRLDWRGRRILITEAIPRADFLDRLFDAPVVLGGTAKHVKIWLTRRPFWVLHVEARSLTVAVDYNLLRGAELAARFKTQAGDTLTALTLAFLRGDGYERSSLGRINGLTKPALPPLILALLGRLVDRIELHIRKITIAYSDASSGFTGVHEARPRVMCVVLRADNLRAHASQHPLEPVAHRPSISKLIESDDMELHIVTDVELHAKKRRVVGERAAMDCIRAADRSTLAISDSSFSFKVVHAQPQEVAGQILPLTNMVVTFPRASASLTHEQYSAIGTLFVGFLDHAAAVSPRAASRHPRALWDHARTTVFFDYIVTEYAYFIVTRVRIRVKEQRCWLTPGVIARRRRFRLDYMAAVSAYFFPPSSDRFNFSARSLAYQTMTTLESALTQRDVFLFRLWAIRDYALSGRDKVLAANARSFSGFIHDALATNGRLPTAFYDPMVLWTQLSFVLGEATIVVHPPIEALSPDREVLPAANELVARTRKGKVQLDFYSDQTDIVFTADVRAELY